MAGGGGDGAPPRTLYLPPGFTATVFTRLSVPGARALAVGPAGEVYVSVSRYGAVDVLVDRDADGFADGREQAAADLLCPHGLAVHDGWLYVAQTGQVTRFALSADPLAPLEMPGETVAAGLPESPCAPHGYRPLALAPAEDALYLAIGSSCDVCVERGLGAPWRARVWRFPLAAPGPGVEVARGLRNVTDLAINPWDWSLWGVSPERDDMGDDTPPDLITRIEPGADYGWPFCYRGPDDAWHPDPLVPPPSGGCDGLTVASFLYQAHSAPVGLAFHDGRGLPPEFGPSLFVALHGSWGHSTGVGYKVVRIPLDAAGSPSGPPQDFATGWLAAPSERWHAPLDAWGRPVDVVVGPDGALYVSDDKSGAIYRFAHAGTPEAPAALEVPAAPAE